MPAASTNRHKKSSSAMILNVEFNFTYQANENASTRNLEDHKDDSNADIDDGNDRNNFAMENGYLNSADAGA